MLLHRAVYLKLYPPTPNTVGWLLVKVRHHSETKIINCINLCSYIWILYSLYLFIILLHWHQRLLACLLLWFAEALHLLSKGEVLVCPCWVFRGDRWRSTGPICYVESDVDIHLGARGQGTDELGACGLCGLRRDGGLGVGGGLSVGEQGHGLWESWVWVV